MGMFDYVKFTTKCPECGTLVNDFQTKDADQALEEVEFWEVDNFYSTCPKCEYWIEFNYKDELKKDRKISDYNFKTYKI